MTKTSLRPITTRVELASRGGQSIILVGVDRAGIMSCYVKTVLGKLHKGAVWIHSMWRIDLRDSTYRFDGYCYLGDFGIGSRNNCHVIFPFSSRLFVILQDIVQRQNFDEYVELVSNSLSGQDKEKWDAYVKQHAPHNLKGELR